MLRCGGVRSVVGNKNIDLAPRVVAGNQEVLSFHNLCWCRWGIALMRKARVEVQVGTCASVSWEWGSNPLTSSLFMVLGYRP